MSDPRAFIFCASTQYWDEAWFRKQHFMSRLSQSRPVVYVEPSFSILRRPPGGCPQGQANPIFRPRVRERRERLWIYTPPRGLPFWTHPAVSGLQYRHYGRQMRARAAAWGAERIWLWLYNPLYVQAAKTLRPERIILDLVDEMTAYEAAAHSRRNMRQCLDTALTQADLVFTTSKKLAETYGPRCKAGRAHVVSNGVRGDWCRRVEPEPPAELAGLPRPWIGLAGALFSYLDYDLLRAAARAYPQGRLILVGPELDTAETARLRAEPNIVFTGRVPQERIPAYLQSFDVCLCPFRAGAVRTAVNPLKVYEYLAAGRPVVSTPLESLAGEPVARWIRFAQSAEEFVRAIGEVLSGDGDDLRRQRREAVLSYSWEVLSDEVERILEGYEQAWGGTQP